MKLVAKLSLLLLLSPFHAAHGAQQAQRAPAKMGEHAALTWLIRNVILCRCPACHVYFPNQHALQQHFFFEEATERAPKTQPHPLLGAGAYATPTLKQASNADTQAAVDTLLALAQAKR